MSDNAGMLLEWMERQYLLSYAAMLRAVSATELVKVRRHFGQTIRPAPGSVLASPEIASYDPNSDYFFHWVRDSAIVIDALRVLLAEQTLGSDATRYLVDFVNFSLGLCQLDGRAFLRRGDYRQAIDPAFLPHARSDRDLSQVYRDRVLGEARYNADGTLNILNWARPQNDGPALRALAVLRFFLLDAFRDRIDQASVTRCSNSILTIRFSIGESPVSIFGRKFQATIITRASYNMQRLPMGRHNALSTLW